MHAFLRPHVSRAAAAAVVFFSAGSFVSLSAQSLAVSGTISYRERIALPPAAVADITLEDTTRPGGEPRVIAERRQALPARPPAPFDLPVDARRVDPRNRYGVRARILVDDRVLFATPGTVPVLTQGRGAAVELVLDAVAPLGGLSVEPAAARTRAVFTPPISRLPATFSGSLPCEGCANLRYELNLFADDSFVLRTIRTERTAVIQDELGTWVVSSDRRALVLRTSRGLTESFEIVDENRLRRMDPRPGNTPGAASELRRARTFTPFDARVTAGGWFTPGPDGGRFVECSTGQAWAVGAGGVGRDLGAPGASPRLSTGRFAIVHGSLDMSRIGPAGTNRPILTVDRIEPSLNQQTCPPRFASLPLERTYWRLTQLAERSVPPSGVRDQPSLTLDADRRSFGGATGCNRIAGNYRASDDGLALTISGTMKACPAPSGLETEYVAALRQARTYRILGTSLELFDDQKQLVAVFDGRQ